VNFINPRRSRGDVSALGHMEVPEAEIRYPVKVPGREFTLAEIAGRTTRESCFLVAGSRVYDVTTW
jgi:hypothetical protein